MKNELGADHTTIDRRLKDLGYVQKIGAWIPYQLTESQKEQRVTICNNLLLRRCSTEWLKHIMTGDEKWLLYFNQTCKRQWVLKGETPESKVKPDMKKKKAIFSVWWDYEGIIYRELVPHGTTMTATFYCSQIDHLQEALQEKRPEKDKILLLHDNASPHTVKVTRKKLQQLGQSVLPHPAYLPDLSPSDYYLFRHLSTFLKEKRYNNDEQLILDIDNFFSSHSSQFYRDAIFQFPQRWTDVVDVGGIYYVD